MSFHHDAAVPDRPLDAHIDELHFGQTYPGAVDLAPEHAVPALVRDDLGLAWGLDFHYPRGILPLSHELVCVLAAASRSAAEALPAVTGRGVACRVVGPHVFTAGIPVLDPAERAERAAVSAAHVAAYPQTFVDLWRECEKELNVGYAELGGLRLPDLTRDELNVAFARAITHYTRAWVIHFEVMYPMLAVAEVFRTVCRAVGVGDADSADLIASGDSSIRRVDESLRALARSARQSGLMPLLDRPSGMLQALRADPPAARWLGDFERFLDLHGERSDAIVDVGAKSWRDEPDQALGLIRDLLVQDADEPTRGQIRRVEDARRQRTQVIADRLTGRDRSTFLRSLEHVRSANFAWWNEDHNSVIDLRAHLPVSRLAGEIAVRHGLARSDAPYLFAEEVRHLGDLKSAAALASERRRYFASWREQRATLPRLFGTPEPINDPVLAEIVGVPPAPVDDVRARVLHGLGSSPGIARGRARVVTTPDGLHRMSTGDILVCEATSPSWTVVFPRLAGCVCDAGGVLTHAAIICREYGLPCVSAVGIATRVIKDGDLIEVDGTAGTVTMVGVSA